MKLESKDILKQLTNLLKKLEHYSVFIFIIFFLLIYSFLVLRINLLTRQEPPETAINDKLQSVARPKIDKTALDKIQSLQDQNTDVQSLFKQARDNPFSE